MYAETARSAWIEVLGYVDEIVQTDAETGSVLALLSEHVPDLENTLSVTATQGTQFLRAALSVAPEGSSGVELSPVAPLARAGLLAFSKILSIATPLCWETRGTGPAFQHHHDTLIEAIVEQDRLAVFDPAADSAQVWLGQGRSAITARLNALREALGKQQIVLPKKPGPGHRLVSEGAWIHEGLVRCNEIRALEGRASTESDYRMRWAWHRASVVAHAGFGTIASSKGLALIYLTPLEASDLIRVAIEMVVASQRVLSGIWFAEAAPDSFSWNSNYRVPSRAPSLIEG